MNSSTPANPTATSSSLPSPPPSPQPPATPSRSINEGRDGVKGRNLVLCFDGTTNTFGKQITNVPLFYSYLSHDASQQLNYYQPGIGTPTLLSHQPSSIFSAFWKEVKHLADAAFAFSLGDHVMRGYQFLVNHYEEGDRIFLVGFSRGAYTARALAGMLHSVGLVHRGNEESILIAYRLYRQGGNDMWGPVWQFRKIFARVVGVHAILVWDTVNSVGYLAPRTVALEYPEWVDHFRHALALDDNRSLFQPKFANRMPSTHPWAVLSDVKEAWFPGQHSDVGGTYDVKENPLEDNLSSISFRWVLTQAVELGLIVDETSLLNRDYPDFGFAFPSSGEAASLLRAGRTLEALDCLNGFVDGVNLSRLDLSGLAEFLELLKTSNPKTNPVVAATIYIGSKLYEDASTAVKDATFFSTFISSVDWCFEFYVKAVFILRDGIINKVIGAGSSGFKKLGRFLTTTIFVTLIPLFILLGLLVLLTSTAVYLPLLLALAVSSRLTGTEQYLEPIPFRTRPTPPSVNFHDSDRVRVEHAQRTGGRYGNWKDWTDVEFVN